MTTEERLRDALEWRAATATRSAGALDDIRRRAGRRRWTARLQVAGAAVATTAVVVAVAALATPRGTDPAPPVTTTGPTASPTTSPTASPTASPSASPTGTAAARVVAGADEYVALLDDGRVVLVSATDGRIGRTVTTFALPELPYHADVDLASDRSGAYVATGPCEPIQHVAFGTGERTELPRGYGAEPSADGTRLAYAVQCGGPAVDVRDLRTGETVRFPYSMVAEGDSYPAPWSVDRVVWHADGKRLWVLLEWEGETSLRLLDPATHDRVNDAHELRSRFTTYGLERRGDDLVFLHRCCYPEDAEPASIVVREPSGRERVVVTSPASGRLSAAQAGPDGDLLYTQSNVVYRLDLDTGRTVELGRSNALARDW